MSSKSKILDVKKLNITAKQVSLSRYELQEMKLLL